MPLNHLLVTTQLTCIMVQEWNKYRTLVALLELGILNYVDNEIDYGVWHKGCTLKWEDL